MLLSLSYEEYNNWAEHLESLQPQNTILDHHRTQILALWNRGHPWSHALQGMAAEYFDTDHSRDPERYGYAASTYQLMLRHRKELRLERKERRKVTLLYGTIFLNLFAKYGVTMKQSFGAIDPNEFKFIVETALPIVEEYINSYPQDKRVRKVLEELRKFLKLSLVIWLLSRWWWLYLLGLATGALLGYYALPDEFQCWGILGGGLLGLLIVSGLLRRLVR